MTERQGVARLTRVVAAPTESAGLMPPLVGAPKPTPAPGQRVVTPPPVHLTTPTGVARLTPKSAAVEQAGRELRTVMGHFATGVTVVTTMHRETVHGMTANSFLSVSLRPPLVLVSLGRCKMAEMLPRSGRYGISVLAHDQEKLAAHFAGRPVEGAEPQFVIDHDMALLDGALAHVVCRVVDAHEAGDHVLWIGEVEHLSHRDAEPLLFYAGRFGTLRDVEERSGGG